MLQTREGEALVACTAVLEVHDAATAATVLDDRYRHDGDGWVEVFAIGDDEEILRATMSMTGSRLSVATHSEPRLDRVLAVLRNALPDARLVSDQRTPLAPGQLPSPPTISGPAPPGDPHTLADIQDLLERRWIDESVPALAGLTPRQAAADPTRRDELRRLLASFPSDERLPFGAVTMRRERLAHLLGL
ncbi:MAG: hypothetical protein M3Y04_04070 [Actinomycetota bacterium]|nr:hypothetical protein [Actinomycetota bacterium]